jgi:hypothetical protein
MTPETLAHILNLLRRGTTTWNERTNCLNRGRRKRSIGHYKNGKEKFLWERQCDSCREWFLLKDNSLEIDHVDPVMGFKGSFDDWINRLYCDPKNLQALCIPCHLEKSSNQNARLKYERKFKRSLEEL